MTYPENSTAHERIQYYMETDEEKRAVALSQLVGYLESCSHWDIKLFPGSDEPD